MPASGVVNERYHPRPRRRIAGRLARGGLATLGGGQGLAAALAQLPNRLLDLLGGLPGTCRQAAYLIGDHGKAAPAFAGPRRLDGGIQRQQVGLLGNAVNDVGDAADRIDRFRQLRDRAGDVIHRFEQRLQRLLALHAGVLALFGQLVYLLGSLGGVLQVA